MEKAGIMANKKAKKTLSKKDLKKTKGGIIAVSVGNTLNVNNALKIDGVAQKGFEYGGLQGGTINFQK
jgi:tryptophanase